MGEGTLYSWSREELREGLQRKLADWKEETEALEDALQSLDALPETSKPCLFCDGRMVDLRPLFRLDRGTGYGTPMLRVQFDGGHREVFPGGWECQDCGIYEVASGYAGRGRIYDALQGHQVWEFGRVPTGKALAKLIFEMYPFVSRVAYYWGSPPIAEWTRGGWLLEVGDDWYFVEGPREVAVATLRLQR